MFLVCSHLKKVRSIAYKCGTNKAPRGARSLNSDTICSPFVLFEKINVQAKKDIATPTPKNPEGIPIYKAPQKILADFEDLMKVSRERLYVPPGSSFPAF